MTAAWSIDPQAHRPVEAPARSIGHATERQGGPHAPRSRYTHKYLVKDRFPAGLLHTLLDLLRQRLGVPVGGVEDDEDLKVLGLWGRGVCMDAERQVHVWVDRHWCVCMYVSITP